MKAISFLLFLLLLISDKVRADDNAAEWKRLNREGKKALEKNDFVRAKDLLFKAAAKACRIMILSRLTERWKLCRKKGCL